MCIRDRPRRRADGRDLHDPRLVQLRGDRDPRRHPPAPVRGAWRPDDVRDPVLLLVSGVYYPITVLPGWMQVVAHISPATYALEGVRKGLIDGVPVGQLLGDIWPLIVMGILFIPVGL